MSCVSLKSLLKGFDILALFSAAQEGFLSPPNAPSAIRLFILQCVLICILAETRYWWRWPLHIQRTQSTVCDGLWVFWIVCYHLRDDLRMGTAYRRERKGVFWCFTWSDTEDFVKVSTDAHLLVELRGLGQVCTGFKVGDGEDICSTLAGSCEKHKRHTRCDHRYYFDRRCEDREVLIILMESMAIIRTWCSIGHVELGVGTGCHAVYWKNTLLICWGW